MYVIACLWCIQVVTEVNSYGPCRTAFKKSRIFLTCESSGVEYCNLYPPSSPDWSTISSAISTAGILPQLLRLELLDSMKMKLRVVREVPLPDPLGVPPSEPSAEVEACTLQDARRTTRRRCNEAIALTILQRLTHRPVGMRSTNAAHHVTCSCARTLRASAFEAPPLFCCCWWARRAL